MLSAKRFPGNANLLIGVPRSDSLARCRFLPARFPLKTKTQRHLHLPRASDCLCHLAQTAQGNCRNNWEDPRYRPWMRKLMAKARTPFRPADSGHRQVLCDVVYGNIEAGSIQHVKDVKGVL